MGRPLRRQVPGQYYLLTTRCHQARFFLRPDGESNDAVLEWLTRAQRRFPSIRIYAVCVMSNHLHLVLRDDEGELAAWASYALGNLARAVNRIRGRTGTFFERRYSIEPILDAEALHDRLVYVVTNPVKAALCDRASDWPGVVLFAPDKQRIEIPVSWIDRDANRHAKRLGEMIPESAAARVGGTLYVDPIPAIDGPGFAIVAVEIEARERVLVSERTKSRGRTLTPARVLSQPWHAAPRKPKRSPRPLCHAADPALRAAFKEGFQAFAGAFWEASQRIREGARNVRFPDWSFPPGRPLIRPDMAGNRPLTV